MNDYTRGRRREELLAHFNRRFADDLKDVHARCSSVDVSADMHEDARGRLTATVTLTCRVGQKVTSSRALYEYRQRSASASQEGWHCYNDWRD
jgi:hypothetical protein